ncbi:MAG: hypothetical protein JW993_17220 [Sedimentisphaerales bacterium]|nr:hypothetical protein [Sedimentisphaerales bacterium]
MTMRDPSSTDTDFMAFANLHDVFLNATVCRSNMLKAPIVEDVEAFLASDRGRLERVWVMFLYVLIEAWRSRAMRATKSYMVARAPDFVQNIDRLIAEGEKNGNIERMRSIRDYMCHRDRRRYWDAGRVDVAGQLIYHEAICQGFSEAFLEVVKHSSTP